jgi:ribonuclease R
MFWLLITFFFKKEIKSRKLIWLSLLGLVPVGCALLLWILRPLYIKGGIYISDIFPQINYILYIHFLLPLMSIFVGTSIIADEVEDQTLTYYFVRPISRWNLISAKSIGGLALVFLILLVSSILTYSIIVFDRGISIWFSQLTILVQGWGVLLFGLMVYIPIFGFLGGILKRPILFGLVFSFGWENMVAYLPGYLKFFTVVHYLHNLYPTFQKSTFIHFIVNAPKFSPVISVIALLALSIFFHVSMSSLLYLKEYNKAGQINYFIIKKKNDRFKRSMSLKYNIYKKFEASVIQFLDSNPNNIYKSRELAKKLNISNTHYRSFKQFVRELANDGKVRRYKGNRYGKPLKPVMLTGTLRVKVDGYGFLIRDDEGEDVFVSQRNIGTALHRDRVKVELWPNRVGKLPDGKVVEILERSRKRIVGTYKKADKYYIVVPDEARIARDIYVDKKNRKDALPGQKVVVEIVKYGNTNRRPEGIIIEVLGYPKEKGVDILSVIWDFDLPMDFPDSVKLAVEKIESGIPESEAVNRLNLKDKLIFTIDPDDAKDYDDAISLEILSNGNYLLGVHIADVGYYVQPATALDCEALKRGTSIYLVDRVIPMLPERLSNDLCSLKPDEDRLTYSVIMELDQEGALIDYRIQDTLIRSQYRLTYKEVQRIIDSHLNDNEYFGNSYVKVKPELQKTLIQMIHLSRKLRKRWRKTGMIDFEKPEAEIRIDKKGHPVEIKLKECLESHKLIESFMLLANQTVATHVQKLRQKTGQKYPFIYRIHEKPGGKKLDDFIHFVSAMGYHFNVGKRITPKKFQMLLDEIKGTRHEVIIELVALRTMMKAVYDIRNIGHFGLAFSNYTHYTSPIRRYPDLVVHRLLKTYNQDVAEAPRLAARLSEICKIATDREIKAQEVERETILTKQVEFMADRIGEDFDGVISGLTSFGIFVEIPKYLVEGMIHVENLKDDYYIYDDKHYRFIGERKGRVFQLGDSVLIRVEEVIREMRKVNFILVDN